MFFTFDITINWFGLEFRVFVSKLDQFDIKSLIIKQQIVEVIKSANKKRLNYILKF
jgi:hypothetical protein